MSLAPAIAGEDAAWLTLHATERVADLFESLCLFVGGRSRLRVHPEFVLRIPKTAVFEEYAAFPSGGMLYDVGAFSYAETDVSAMKLGRYCSVATALQVMGERHPIERVTSSSFTYCFKENWNKPAFLRAHRDLLGGRSVPDMPPTLPVPVLEHDVWVGQGVTLARGIRLHTGCVVAAGAVVTRDVAPYTVVGGVPARPIKLRFSEGVCARLLATRWWACHPGVLYTFGHKDAALFCDRFEEAAAEDGVPAWSPRQYTWRTLRDALA